MLDVENEIENIDTSEHIRWSEKDPLIKPERAAKGDIRLEVDCSDCGGHGRSAAGHCRRCRGRGRVPDHRAALGLHGSEIRYAQAMVRNVLNWLWNNRQITDQAYHDAKTYELWRAVMRAHFGGNTTSALFKQAKGELKAEGLDEYGYVLLLRRMDQADQRVVEMAIDLRQSEHNLWLVRRQVGQYRAALDNLSGLIPAIREELQQRADTQKTNPFTDEMAMKLLADRMGLKKNA